jgi:hypothetical protein
LPLSDQDDDAVADVSAHGFAGFDDSLDDDEPVAPASADEDDDSPDVQPHGMSGFG